jgi:hypothetical protein
MDEAERDAAHAPEDAGYPELLIDGHAIPHGRLPNGLYFLAEYSYDWHENLIDVARGLIDHDSNVDEEN